MKKITIYTGPMCNYCEAAKRLLTRNNATYDEINITTVAVSYTHLRAHETVLDLVCRLLLEKKKY